MKIAIVGAGAMGSVYAALLGDAGHEVWAIDSWAEHIAAIRKLGLRVEGASGDRVVRVNATGDAREVGPCDLVIVATKAMHITAAAAQVPALLGPDTAVLTIQNGLGSADRLAEALAGTPVMIGVAGGFGASMKGPGHAHHNGMELIRLGNRNGAITPALTRVAAVWEQAGFKARTFDDIAQLVWEKLICNVCFSASTALTEWTIGEVMADTDTWRMAAGCASEAYAVARAKNIALDFDDPVAYARAFGEKIPNAYSSLALDLMAGRASEIDAINGAIPPAGHDVGIEAPYNQTLSALVRAKETRLGVRAAAA
ncbi:MAG: 2-dehydropantoate 2-reductase [Proteobacteria bacterium]|nr:2-dehydropantoate 2-reductase [Pseudomonadota bacterium]